MTLRAGRLRNFEVRAFLIKLKSCYSFLIRRYCFFLVIFLLLNCPQWWRDERMDGWLHSYCSVLRKRIAFEISCRRCDCQVLSAKILTVRRAPRWEVISIRVLQTVHRCGRDVVARRRLSSTRDVFNLVRPRTGHCVCGANNSVRWRRRFVSEEPQNRYQIL